MEIPELLKKIYLRFLDSAQTLLFFISFLLILYMFVIQPHQVSGASMFPTFKDQEFLLSFLLDVKLHAIRHGDVVVFHSPTEEDKLFIKRVIGMPGDRVEVENGVVFLNGKKLDEHTYLKETVATYGGSFLPDGREVIVPNDTLFVMGDNRPYSSDSRAWGFLVYEKLIGRSVLRVWPTDKFTFISRDPYNK